MANRTLHFWGQGWADDHSESTTEIVASFNGNQVYSGPVTTKNWADTNYTRNFADQQILFSVEVDESVVGNIPIQIACTAGESVDCSMINWSAEWFARHSINHTLPANINIDSVVNPMLDGVAVGKGPDAFLFPPQSNWTWNVPKGSVFTYTLAFDPSWTV